MDPYEPYQYDPSMLQELPDIPGVNISGYLRDMAANIGQQVGGLTDQREQLRKKQEESIGKQIGSSGVAGSMALPMLTGMFLGGNAGLTAGAEGALMAGKMTYNNLQMDELKRQKFLDREVDRTEKEMDYLRSRGTALDTAGLGLMSNYAQGSFPGTPPADALVNSRVDAATRIAQAKENAMGDVTSIERDLLGLALENVGKPADPDELNKIGPRGLRNAATLVNRLQDQTEEQRRKQEQLGRISQTENFVLPTIPSMRARPFTAREIEKVNGAKRLEAALERYKTLLTNGDEEGAAKQGKYIAESSLMFTAARNFQDTGARLEGREPEIILGTMPAPFGSVADWKQWVFGNIVERQDPEFIDYMIKALRQDVAKLALSSGRYDPLTPEAYNPQEMRLLKAKQAKFGEEYLAQEGSNFTSVPRVDGGGGSDKRQQLLQRLERILQEKAGE